MEILTYDGIKITCLPDCAKCTYEGKHPEDMEKCPLYNFDDEGDICVPECCNHYTEESVPGDSK